MHTHLCLSENQLLKMSRVLSLSLSRSLQPEKEVVLVDLMLFYPGLLLVRQHKVLCCYMASSSENIFGRKCYGGMPARDLSSDSALSCSSIISSMIKC